MNSTLVKKRGVSQTPGLLATLAAVLMMVALYMALIYAPREQTMGDVQRIFYFHVPAAWVAFLAFFLVFVFSSVYLLRGGKQWDTRAAACAEVGILFCSLVLITGHQLPGHVVYR